MALLGGLAFTGCKDELADDNTVVPPEVTPDPELALLVPSADTALTLDYKTPAVIATTFEWSNVEATRRELLFSKNADMSNPVVMEAPGTSKAFTHAELQAFIGTALAPKKYKTNTVYWTVRIDNQATVTPRALKLGGYRLFTYPNSSANTYEVSVVALSGNKAGQEVVWLSTNFRETHDKNGSVFSSGEALPAANYPKMAEELKPIAGYYYNNNVGEGGLVLIKTRLIPPGWELPSMQDFRDLWVTALLQEYTAAVLMKRYSNKWNLNFGDYGTKRWGSDFGDYGGEWHCINNPDCFTSQHDYAKDKDYGWPHPLMVAWAGYLSAEEHCGAAGLACVSPHYLKDDSYGEATVRAIYRGDDE
jgi:hypothetical protein